MTTGYDQVAEAIANSFTSPNVHDSNGDEANIVDVINYLATAVKVGARDLGNGNAASPMGAIEAHGVAIKEAASTIADAIMDLANAIRDSN